MARLHAADKAALISLQKVAQKPRLHGCRMRANTRLQARAPALQIHLASSPYVGLNWFYELQHFPSLGFATLTANLQFNVTGFFNACACGLMWPHGAITHISHQRQFRLHNLAV